MATTTNSDTVFSPSRLPVKVTGMQAMASKMWMPFLAMGFMIVVAAFIIGLVNSATAADYLAASKVTREAAARGTELATQRAFIEATKIWLPAVKFLGLGMMLGGITFLLATILGALRTGGGRVQEALGVEVRIVNPPMTARLFPMFMMMGTMILIASLIISIPTATLAYGYWNHSIAAELDTAVEGSGLLADLGTINAIKLWLEPFKFVGMAFLFTGIGLALATIVRVLRWQSSRLWDIL
ncbi:MAG: hypothetical protein L0177_10020 [Chloroflexi bacterium]|nr:hypothetical protein [Chloroflexota bacterium]